MTGVLGDLRKIGGIGVAAASLLVACAPAPVTRQDTRVAELRAEGRFAAALTVARADLAAQSRAHGIPRWRVASARLDVETLELIAALPDSQRLALAAVERLIPSRVTAEGAWQHTLPALQLQLATRERLLGADHPDAADTRSAIGRLEWLLGNAVEANAQSRRAIEIRRRAFGEEHPSVLESIDQLAQAVRLAGIRPQQGDSLFDHATVLGRRIYPRGSPELATVLHHAANSSRARGRLDLANRYFAEALKLGRRVYPDSSVRVAEILTDWAATRVMDRQPEQAVQLAREAVAILDRPGTREGPQLPLALNSLGKALLRSGRPRDALPVLMQTVQAQELRWRSLRPDLGRSRVVQFAGWMDVAAARIALGDSTGAFEAYARGLARGVVERAAGRAETPDASRWQNLLGRVRRALPESTAVVGWLQHPVAGVVGEPFWCFVIRRGSGIHWVRVSRPERRFWIGRHRPYSPAQSEGDLAVSLLRARMRAAGAWPLRVEVDAQIDSLSTALHALRVQPIEPWLDGVRELVVVSPDVHHDLPVEFLHAPGGPTVLDRFVVSYAPNPLCFVLEAESRRGSVNPRAWRTLVVGATNHGFNRRARRESREVLDEVDDVRRAFPRSRVLLGAGASEAALRTLAAAGELERFDLIHLAGHQQTDRIFALDTGLALAEAYEQHPGELLDLIDARDGRLTPFELDEMHLQARLVVMASCNSLGSTYTMTEGALGLGAAALRAGAHSVLVSAWNVEDRAAHLLVTTFYDRLTNPRGRPVTAAEALRDARLAVRDWRAPDGTRPYAHPAYWAGFALLGSTQ